MTDKNIRFFLVANSADGFYSLFSQLYDPNGDNRAVIIKGGPGTGKSSFMKRIADEAQRLGFYTERISCSSDPQSLDAVIIPELKFSIADGTAPHTLEPIYPGAVEEILNLGECWNSKELHSKADEIRNANARYKSFHAHARDYIHSAGTLRMNSIKTLRALVNEKRVSEFVDNFIKEIEESAKSKDAKISKRILTGISPDGIITYYNTIENLCDKIVILDDPSGTAADCVMKKIAQSAVENGIDVITCMSPLFPQEMIEHIILPQCGICLTLKNDLLSAEAPAKASISLKTFYKQNEYDEFEEQLIFNSTVSKALLEKGCTQIKNAKKAHDELEALYIPSMDFDAVNKKKRKMLDELFAQE